MQFEDRYKENQWRRFEVMCPSYATRVVEIKDLDPFEVAYVLNDDTVLVYDYLDDSSRLYFSFDEFDNRNNPTSEWEWKKRFGRSLYRKSILRAWRQTHMAEEVGMPESSIANYMNRETTPSIWSAMKLSHILNIPVSKLIFSNGSDDYIPDMNISEEEWRKQFAHNLKIRMFKCNYSQTELARDCDITTTSIHRYVKATATPNSWIIVKLTRALDCSVYDLIHF